MDRTIFPLGWCRRLSAMLALLALVLPTAPIPLSQAQSQQLIFPADFMPSVKDYGAKGDGVTDDTAALRRALADERSDTSLDYYGRPRALFFPAGVYLVSDTLFWEGCCMTLQGQGSSQSIIRLKNNATGFSNGQSPKPIIRAPRVEGNKSFRQNVWNLGIDSGNGNPGAVGLDYISSNSGAVRDVAIRAGDGAGVAGLALTQAWPGPLLVKGLRVDGFDVGVLISHPEYGPTFENITLTNQRVAGLRNDGNNIVVRRISSTNRVPAVVNVGGMVAILDGTFSGGAENVSAINNQGTLYARNIVASGYQSAIRNQNDVVPGLTHDEYLPDKIYSLFASPQRMLNLPIGETPAWHDNNPQNWAVFAPRWYGDTGQLQTLFDSGKSTVAFPFGGYLSYDERTIVVPPTVKRIVGFSSIVNGDSKGNNGGGIRFVVEGGGEPLIVEQFGYGVKVEQRGTRPVAIKHGNYQYVNTPGAGDLYLEDVEIGNFVVRAGQRVWARQFNNETKATKIRNQGGQLWIMGLKTEQIGTIIETTNGGATELLGTLIYPADTFPPDQQEQAAFISRDSRVSLIYGVSNYLGEAGYYAYQVEETRGGVTRRLATSEAPGEMPMFVGYPDVVIDPLPANAKRQYLPLLARVVQSVP
jgi:hypothetical protein